MFTSFVTNIFNGLRFGSYEKLLLHDVNSSYLILLFQKSHEKYARMEDTGHQTQGRQAPGLLTVCFLFFFVFFYIGCYVAIMTTLPFSYISAFQNLISFSLIEKRQS